MNVAVLGASHKPERYSYMAVKLLAENGHRVFPVNPALKAIDSYPVYPSLKDIPETIHTLTIYLNPERSSKLNHEIIALNPKRVIFNPGTENPVLAQDLQAAGAEVLHACTLVLLKMKSF